jgi:hypothetical protein|tara:strand:- start:294 stop:485 length:192 start_codon:yes stop_codon:yes gene_type:complete
MKKIVYVTPLSWTAKDRFDEMMDNFHMCTVVEETKKHYLLHSLNKKYMFHCQKEGNEHWKITV